MLGSRVYSIRTLPVVLATFLVAAALPVTIYLAQQQQDLRKRAQEEGDRPLAPYVAIVSPSDGEKVRGTTHIEATLLNNAQVKGVEFYIDQKLRTTVEQEPFIYEWDASEGVGSHTITVRAFDAHLNVGTKTITVYRE